MKRRAKDRTYPRQEQPKKMFQTDHIKVQVNLYGGPHVNWVVVWSCVINQLWTASLFCGIDIKYCNIKTRVFSNILFVQTRSPSKVYQDTHF